MDNVKELKSQAFDCLVMIEKYQLKLSELNRAIRGELNKEVEKPKE